MFNLVSRKQTTVAPAVIQDIPQDAVIIPFPSSKIPKRLVDNQKQQSYSEIAKSIGFHPAGLVQAQLIEFFENEKIKLYDYDQVKVWLTEKRKKADAAPWCWRPLREKDVIEEYSWLFVGGPHDSYYKQCWACRPYDLLVPRHALEKVVKIETCFKDQVKFFVSHFEKPGEDPFIMVRANMTTTGPDNKGIFVFDAWDEPGFGL